MNAEWRLPLTLRFKNIGKLKWFLINCQKLNQWYRLLCMVPVLACCVRALNLSVSAFFMNIQSILADRERESLKSNKGTHSHELPVPMVRWVCKIQFVNVKKPFFFRNFDQNNNISMDLMQHAHKLHKLNILLVYNMDDIFRARKASLFCASLHYRSSCSSFLFFLFLGFEVLILCNKTARKWKRNNSIWLCNV